MTDLPLVTRAQTIRQALDLLDASARGIVLVTDSGERLLGTVTDGDIRRGLLRDLSMEDMVELVMNPAPITAPVGTSPWQLLGLMKTHTIRQIPLTEADGRVVDLVLWNELIGENPQRSSPVIILAGGLGKRLRPLTEDTPKPMLPIDGKPLLQVIIEQLRWQGFHNVLVSVYYLAEQIEQFLGDGSRWGLNVSYIREEKPLGTAGAVRLAKRRLEEPFLVLNGDLLTRLRFDRFLDYHTEHDYPLTVALKHYEMQVPYGVVDLAGDRVIGLREKPVLPFFISAGVYALNPAVISYIPENEYFDMTDVIKQLISGKCAVGGFAVHEYWTDIGVPADYERANDEFTYYFKK